MEPKNRKASRDMLAIAACCVVVFGVASLAGIFDAVDDWARRNRLAGFHVEEMILLLAVAAAGCALHYGLRYREVRDEDSERARAAMRLRESQERIRAQHEELSRLFRQVEVVKNEWERTVDCVGDMVILTGIDGKVTRCNKAFKHFVGKAYGEILGRELEILLAGNGICAGPSHGTEQTVHCGPRGKWYTLKSHPYKELDGSDISGYVVVISDSTVQVLAVAAAGAD